MNAKQDNTRKMGHAVSNALATITATSALPAISAKQTELVNHLNDIKTFSAAQTAPITGQTRAGVRVLGQAIDALLLVASPTLSYAQTHGLDDLIAKVDVTRTTFMTGRRTRRVERLQQVHDAIAAVLPQLADYGVTAEALTAVQDTITAASSVIAVPRANIMSRRVATQKLDGSLRKMKRLISRELDPLMDALRATDPDSHALYRAARVTIDLPGNAPAEAPAPAPATPPPAAAA